MKKSFRVFGSKANRLQVLIGVTGLLAGMSVYLVGRPFNSVYFLQRLQSSEKHFHSLPNLFGKIGPYAPEFFHPFSFSLITIGLFSRNRRSRIIICLFWFTINILFEAGQKYGTQVAEFIPHWFSKVPVLENTKNYFARGTFSIADLTAILLGSAVAFIVAELTSVRGVMTNDALAESN